ncbi:MAG: DUF6691 family protein [Methylophilaceae bacterium]
MAYLSSLIAGLIFGLGLIISGMTNPAKVIGFLDVAGNWDPSLAFVMIGAISIAYFAFRKAKINPRSALGEHIEIPAKRDLDAPLIVGAIIFGIGWGLAGYCPGPAIASVAIGDVTPVLFSIAMLAGMVFYELLIKRLLSK